jgi:hypothetical protein
MTPYMPHSGRKPHVWKCLSTQYREILTRHRWGFRGAYASKYFGDHEYMMTCIKEEGPYRYSLIRRKEDFWSYISSKDRDSKAKKVRKIVSIVQRDQEDFDVRKLEDELFASMAKVRQPMEPD